MIAKPLPDTGIRVFQRMEALIAERDGRLVLVVLKKLVWLAWFANTPAMRASGTPAGFYG
jgi:hypothetical protein